MYGKILVPSDGGRCSEEAVEEAARLDHVLGAQITILCVVDAFSIMRDGLVTTADIVERMHAQAREAVGRAEKACRGAGVAAHGEVGDGKPADEIVRRAREFDLVVIGSHSKSAIKRLVLGSVAQEVLARIDRPALLLKEHREAIMTRI